MVTRRLQAAIRPALDSGFWQHKANKGNNGVIEAALSTSLSLRAGSRLGYMRETRVAKPRDERRSREDVGRGGRGSSPSPAHLAPRPCGFAARV